MSLSFCALVSAAMKSSVRWHPASTEINYIARGHLLDDKLLFGWQVRSRLQPSLHLSIAVFPYNTQTQVSSN